MVRWGLCCIFKEEPIAFKRTTAAFLSKKPRQDQLNHLWGIIAHNGESLFQALVYCHENGIGDFRINSQILPLKTHPEIGYDFRDLPDVKTLNSLFERCRLFAREKNIRLGFHPDQFTLLSSPHEDVTEKSILELVYQAEMAEKVGADVINIHGGGAYGDKKQALSRLRRNIDRLDPSIRTRLTLENDDRVYTPSDLLPVCMDMGIPLVYDAHHHRCLPDGESTDKTSEKALETWKREPLFHISSPQESWMSKNPRNHSDFIDIRDFPECWASLDITVEVEAKAKELAVLRMMHEFERTFRPA